MALPGRLVACFPREASVCLEQLSIARQWYNAAPLLISDNPHTVYSYLSNVVMQEQLSKSSAPVRRVLDSSQAKTLAIERVRMDEATFRWMMNGRHIVQDTHIIRYQADPYPK